ncbi:MAG TPA: ureidoglycolate lyase [Chloroflexota bacterium]|nr:ureidoglycolate lyase [Chloroflexota bacterium]
MTATEARTEQITVKVQPLTAEAFAPYGRVVESDREDLIMERGKFTARLMTVKRVPQMVDHVNMHTDHSQMFVPLAGDNLVVIVAPPEQTAETFDSTSIAAFQTDGTQTFIFHPGTWHIEPRAADKDSCQVINVQTDIFREHTTLIELKPQVRIQV